MTWLLPLAPVRTVAPSADDPLVTLAEAKNHLNIDYGDDDRLISGLIQAATDYIDGYNGILGGRALVTQTWRVQLNAWPCDVIRLPLAPVQSVSSITYYDADNVQQAFAASGNWALYSDVNAPYVALLSGGSWPTSYYTRLDAIAVTFVAGYGPAKAVPQAIKLAVMQLAAHWYENRETVNVGNLTTELPFTSAALLSPYRRVSV
jgi:uncharacterized phiE125 gp8 family phage protein